MNTYQGENLDLEPEEAEAKLRKEIDKGKLSVHTWHDDTTGQFCIMPRFDHEKFHWSEGLALYDLYLAALPVFINKFSMEEQEVEEDDFAAALLGAAKGDTKCAESKKATSGKSTGFPGPERQHTLPKP